MRISSHKKIIEVPDFFAFLQTKMAAQKSGPPKVAILVSHKMGPPKKINRNRHFVSFVFVSFISGSILFCFQILDGLLQAFSTESGLFPNFGFYFFPPVRTTKTFPLKYYSYSKIDTVLFLLNIDRLDIIMCVYYLLNCTYNRAIRS